MRISGAKSRGGMIEVDKQQLKVDKKSCKSLQKEANHETN